ncbi:unnamed protein product [Paramecium sonneborni]|uniref:Uncharacterized protein n=1 Tax=Paramecium sonneborni TaxID=65129 RepID=A0A8S1N2P8_9CILI|nr:unnamed protein product [Paramecium sonneborni]
MKCYYLIIKGILYKYLIQIQERFLQGDGSSQYVRQKEQQKLYQRIDEEDQLEGQENEKEFKIRLKYWNHIEQQNRGQTLQ